MIKRKFIYIILLFVFMFFSGCDNYRTYTNTAKITLVSEQPVQTMSVTTQATLISEKDSLSDDIKVNETDTVYYTKSGKRYHYVNPCGRGTYYECTLEEALAKGLTPCDKCIN